MILVKSEDLLNFSPKCNKAEVLMLTNAINITAQKFAINISIRRIRYFLTHMYCETNGFTAWEENLRYTTPERLVAVWPSRFSLVKEYGKALAKDYINSPEKLANLVYANRYGNGDIESGDGYKYLGRGGLGLTFKDNYKQAGIDLYADENFYLKNPDLVSSYKDGALTAGWFWDCNKLNGLADTDSFTLVTKAINGSIVTVNDRLLILKRANSIWK